MQASPEGDAVKFPIVPPTVIKGTEINDADGLSLRNVGCMVRGNYALCIEATSKACSDKTSEACSDTTRKACSEATSKSYEI